MHPRLPADAEYEALVNYLTPEVDKKKMSEELQQEYLDEAEAMLESSAIAVFDDFDVESLGETGTLIMVMWPGTAGSHQAFLYNELEDKIIEIVEKQIAKGE